jgi:SAM-dependent methyltransferase
MRGGRDRAAVEHEDARSLFERPDVVGEYATFDELLPAERSIIDEVAPTPADRTILDLGVGAGRTSRHLVGRGRLYVGVDVSEAMIRGCRSALPDAPARFLVGDARRLPFPDATFDLVLFSFNGLDTVGGAADRTAALREMARTCVPGGSVCFSSQTLSFVRARLSYLEAVRAFGRFGARRLVRRPGRALAAITTVRRRRSMNPPPRTLRGGATVVELRARYERSSHGFDDPDRLIAIPRYSIDPERQVEELSRIGFDRIRVFGSTGAELPPSGSPPRVNGWPMPYLYYLCRKADRG